MNPRQLWALAGGFFFVYIVITLTNRPQLEPRPREASLGQAAPDGTASGGPAGESPLTIDRIRGFTLLPLPDLAIDEGTSTSRFGAIAATGARWVALRPPLMQLLGTSEEVPPEASTAEQQEGWRRAIKAARAAGLRVMLRPIVVPQDGTRRESIAPPDPSTWLTSYERALQPWLTMAGEEGVELVCLGSNLTRLQGDSGWKALVGRVRQGYQGKLTYASSVQDGAYRQVAFWSDLDYVGIDAYFPLTETLRPEAAQLTAGWQRVAEDLQGWHGGASAPPVLFTAVGVPRLVGGASAPDRPNPDAPADEQAPAQAVDTLFATVWRQPWFAGMFWHCWSGGGPAQAAYQAADTPTGARLEAGYKAP